MPWTVSVVGDRLARVSTISAHGLRKRYGTVHAVDGIDLEVERGTVLGLDVVRDARELKRRIGVSGQYAAVDENLTGFENLEMVGRLYHLGGRRARTRADELLERFGLVEAARILTDEGFQVFPYTTDDLVVGEKLLDAGCRVLMPWCAPIGSAMGPANPMALRAFRAEFPDVPLIVDAGIGRPSHATAVMELGYDAVLLNTAVAGAGDPAAMAEAFAMAIDAGRLAHDAVPLAPRDMAVPSTPVIGKAVFA